jgi:hypothetical protein
VNFEAGTGTFVKDVEKVRGSIRNVGDEANANTRHLNRFATEGLGEIATVSPQLARALDGLASKSATLGAALGVIGFAVAAKDAFEFGQSLGENIRSLVAYGRTVSQVEDDLKKLNDTTKEQQEFLAARKALTGFMLESEKATIAASAASRAAQLRDAGLVTDALEVERRAKLDTLDITERQATAELSALQRAATNVDDRLRFEQQAAALHRRFATERQQINAEASIADRKAVEEELDRRQDAENEIRDMVESRRAVEAGVVASRLEDEGRTVEALNASIADQVAAVQAGAEKQRVAWEKSLRQRQIDQGDFDARVVALEKKTAADVSKIYEDAARTRRTNFSDLASAFPASTNLEQLRADATAAGQVARDAFAAAFAAVRAPVGQPNTDVFATGGAQGIVSNPLKDILAQLEQRRALEEIILTNIEKQEQALARQEDVLRELNKPSLFAGQGAIDALDKRITAAAQQLDEQERSGRITSDQALLERHRFAAQFQQDVERIKTTFAATPGVIDELDRRLGRFVTDALSAFEERYTEAWRAAQQGPLNAVASIEVWDTAVSTLLPGSINTAVTSLDLLSGKLDGVITRLWGAAAAARAFAGVETAGAGQPSSGPTNTGIQVVE